MCKFSIMHRQKNKDFFYNSAIVISLKIFTAETEKKVSKKSKCTCSILKLMTTQKCIALYLMIKFLMYFDASKCRFTVYKQS